MNDSPLRIETPSSINDLEKIVAQASRNKTPVTVAGAKTGLTGACSAESGIILSTEQLNQIGPVLWNDARESGTVTVQPGVTLKALEAVLHPLGFFYPPDPGEKAASIGGTAATNASGPRSLAYGPTRAWIRRVKLLLADATPLEIRRGKQFARNGILPLNTALGKTIPLPLPTYRQPKTKNAAGYFWAPQMDLIDLFIGAEGTLGVFTELELEIRRQPESVVSGMLSFKSETDCFDFALAAKKTLRPRALEFFDGNSVKMMGGKSGAALLFEQETKKTEETALSGQWTRLAQAHGGAVSDELISARPQDHQTFRQYRYQLPVRVNEQAARNGFRKLGTDFAVPDESAREMFNLYRTELTASGIEYAVWGHIGENHLHANLLPKNKDQFEQSTKLYGALARKAVELGGTVSAEHGIGKLRIPYLEMMVGAEGLKQMARLKKMVDPNGILNRGNIFPYALLSAV